MFEDESGSKNAMMEYYTRLTKWNLREVSLARRAEK